MKSNRLIWIAVGISVALSCYTWVQIEELKAESDRAHQIQIDRAKAKQGRMAEVEQRMARLSRKLRKYTQQSTSQKPVAGGAELRRSSPIAVVADELEAVRSDLERLIAEQVQAQVGHEIKKLGQRKRNQNGEWEPPMSELAEELDLTGEQSEAARHIFDASREDVFSLFKTARKDGGSLADDLAIDLKTSGEPGASMKRFFQRLVNDKIPGTDRTYLADLIKLRGQVFESLGDELSEEQMNKLKSLRIDPLQVGTGYDPMKAYIEAQMQQ